MAKWGRQRFPSPDKDRCRQYEGDVLAKLGKRQIDCLRKAVRCREWARHSADPATKADYLKTAESWELLARSYGTSERLDDFLAGCRNRTKLTSRVPRREE
jgi:hypothetical protein